MSCVSDKYSPAELESIFLWDCLCEALPLTAEERREIKERDYTAKTGKKDRRTPDSAVHYNSIAAAKEEERRRKRLEQKRRWRESNKERIRAYDAAYRAMNRGSINERQREYDRAKQASKKAASVSAQP
jgi:hypothetical protein